jgi:BMFP domain-containing protein YqiC
MDSQERCKVTTQTPRLDAILPDTPMPLPEFRNRLLYTGQQLRDYALAAVKNNAAEYEQSVKTVLSDVYSHIDIKLRADAQTIHTQTARIAELEATVEGLRKDAERYRYIRDAGERDYSVICESPRSPYLRMGERLDRAIDAALAPPQPAHREGEGLK